MASRRIETVATTKNNDGLAPRSDNQLANHSNVNKMASQDVDVKKLLTDAMKLPDNSEAAPTEAQTWYGKRLTPAQRQLIDDGISSIVQSGCVVVARRSYDTYVAQKRARDEQLKEDGANNNTANNNTVNNNNNSKKKAINKETKINSNNTANNNNNQRRRRSRERDSYSSSSGQHNIGYNPHYQGPPLPPPNTPPPPPHPFPPHRNPRPYGGYDFDRRFDPRQMVGRDGSGFPYDQQHRREQSPSHGWQWRREEDRYGAVNHNRRRSPSRSPSVERRRRHLRSTRNHNDDRKHSRGKSPSLRQEDDASVSNSSTGTRDSRRPGRDEMHRGRRKSVEVQADKGVAQPPRATDKEPESVNKNDHFDRRSSSRSYSPSSNGSSERKVRRRGERSSRTRHGRRHRSESRSVSSERSYTRDDKRRKESDKEPKDDEDRRGRYEGRDVRRSSRHRRDGSPNDDYATRSYYNEPHNSSDRERSRKSDRRRHTTSPILVRESGKGEDGWDRRKRAESRSTPMSTRSKKKKGDRRHRSPSVSPRTTHKRRKRRRRNSHSGVVVKENETKVVEGNVVVESTTDAKTNAPALNEGRVELGGGGGSGGIGEDATTTCDWTI